MHTSAGWPRWCAAQHEALGLRQRDIAAVRERSDAQAAAVADILVIVFNLRVADVHLPPSGTPRSQCNPCTVIMASSYFKFVDIEYFIAVLVANSSEGIYAIHIHALINLGSGLGLC